MVLALEFDDHRRGGGVLKLLTLPRYRTVLQIESHNSMPATRHLHNQLVPVGDRARRVPMSHLFGPEFTTKIVQPHQPTSFHIQTEQFAIDADPCTHFFL